MSVPPQPSAAAERERLLTPTFLRVTAAGLAYFGAIGVLVPAVPRYVTEELGGGDVEVGVAVGAFFVVAALMRPFVGALGDRVGSRRLIVGGAVAFGLSLLVYHPVSTVSGFVAARAVSGVGEAAIFIGAAAAINELAPSERRGEALSYWSVAVYGGLGLGPFVGEWVLTRGYLWVWLTAAGLCGVAGLLGATAPAGTRTTTPFAVRQLVHRAGVLPGAVLGLGLLGYAGFLAFVPLYVQELGMGGAGRLFLVYAAMVLGIRLTAPWLVDRLGAARAGSFALVGAGLGLLLMGTVRSSVGLFAGTAVMAVGMSMAFPSLMTLAVEWAPVDQRRSVIGTFTAFFDLSQGLGAAALGLLVAPFGYPGVFTAGGISAFVALGVLIVGTRGAPVAAQAAGKGR